MILWRTGNKMIVINSRDLLNEVSDETRFYKKIAANSNQLRNAAGDGLFTVRIIVPTRMHKLTKV